jgi:hypothetical protein
MGMGPMTGGGRGFCARSIGGNQNVGRIGGRGGRGRRNQFYATGLTGLQRTYSVQAGIGQKEESKILKEQASYLADELKTVRSRLTELEKNKAK